jgi:phosphatidylglycerophosphate synthase
VRYATVPNVISIVRLSAAPAVIALAARGMDEAFLALAVLLLLTDWVDGKIARAWNQTTTFGARLDSISDAIIYACIAVGVWLLDPERFWNERYWLAALVASYLASLMACYVKFRCFPSYHLRLAKISWFLMIVGVVALILDLSPWPLRLAMATVIAGNLESIAVTVALRRWRTNIAWLAEAVRNPDGTHSQEAADRSAL